jgi:cytidine deaminase
VTFSRDSLIDFAASRLNPHRVGDRLLGDVAAVLISDRGNRYEGVCIDTGSGTGFCAERAAIAAMVTAGEYRIDTIVAVWRDDSGALYVLPPCGRCRDFIRQVDPANIHTEVVLGRRRSTSWPDCSRNMIGQRRWRSHRFKTRVWRPEVGILRHSGRRSRSRVTAPGADRTGSRQEWTPGGGVCVEADRVLDGAVELAPGQRHTLSTTISL